MLIKKKQYQKIIIWSIDKNKNLWYILTTEYSIWNTVTYINKNTY
jgi:hypothetical protein